MIGDPTMAVNSRITVLCHVWSFRPRDVWELTVGEFVIFARAADQWVEAHKER